MLAMLLEEDAEIIGEEKALHYLMTGELEPAMFNGDLAIAEAQGFFNALVFGNSALANVH